jgi:PIN domain
MSDASDDESMGDAAGIDKAAVTGRGGEDDDEADDDLEMFNDDYDIVLPFGEMEAAGPLAGSPPSLYTRQSFYRQTRKRGKIVKNVNEVYLRDDLGYGTYYAEDASKAKQLHAQVETLLGEPHTIESPAHLVSLLSPDALVVCDTNVLLHHWDVLEQAGDVLPNIVLTQTALEECRAQRRVAYERAVDWLRILDVKRDKDKDKGEDEKRRKSNSNSDNDTRQRGCRIFFADPHHVYTAQTEILEVADADDDERAMGGEMDDQKGRNKIDKHKKSKSGNKSHSPTINDLNDARIRRVADFYGTALKSTGISVILLTDDADSRARAAASSSLYQAISVRSWVTALEKRYPDLGLLDRVAQFDAGSRDNLSLQATASFVPHLDSSEMLTGIQKSLYYRGIFRGSQDSAIVTIRHGSDRVAVTLEGSEDCNRAVDGDVVAIALHPLDMWKRSVLSRPMVAAVDTDTWDCKRHSRAYAVRVEQCARYAID